MFAVSRLRGQIEVRFITAITITLAVLFSAITINSIATKGPDEDLVATNLATLWQLTRVADKYTGEALSYAYYREVNSAFRPEVYSNEQRERWEVQSWFIYPTPKNSSKASCATVDNKLGCVIWNLDGGTDNKHPCPEPVSYTPNPNPRSIFSWMQEKRMGGYLTEALREVNMMVARGTEEGGRTYGLYLFGKNTNIEYAIKVTANRDKTKVNADGKVNVTIADQLGRWAFEVNRLIDTNVVLTAKMKNVTHSEDKAGLCICKEVGRNDPKVIGRYEIVEHYIEVTVKNKNTGEIILEDNIPYIKYFGDWVYKPVYDGVTEYYDCELIVP